MQNKMDTQHHENKELDSSNDLTRHMTLSLSPEQYERLFFQPTSAKGDLAKRLGNPTLLGTMGFLIPFTTTVLCALQWQGAGPASFTGISGTYYFLGGIAMNIAGICEFILGNTYPFAVFVIYGSHWCNLAYTMDPIQGIIASYTAGKVPGADSIPYTSGQGMYNIVMLLISFCFFLGALRTNVPFALAIFCLMPLFGLFAAAEFAIGTAKTAADGAHILFLIKVAGGFGLVTAISGWYLAIQLACASTGVPCPLPAMDLSTKLFRSSEAAAIERGGNAV
ncbi:hypothetical protein Vi05172_g6875 [Venturia inaequalis]|nr:hypothetical protein Vi05172_g6875 [Venturia inaequalis]